MDLITSEDTKTAVVTQAQLKRIEVALQQELPECRLMSVEITGRTLLRLIVDATKTVALNKSRTSAQEKRKPAGLTDLSPMPLGRAHKGKLMQDVPVKYLHWWWTADGNDRSDECPVNAYIRTNLNALKQEYKDGIWD